MKITITKDEALEAWNNPKTKVLFEIAFKRFEDYWKECEEFNNATKEEQKEMVKNSLEKLKKIDKMIQKKESEKNKKRN